MSKIQEETEAMLVAAEILTAAKATSFAGKEAEKIAKRLAHVEIPAFERVRQTAEEELAMPGGLSDLISESYHSALSGIESKWGEGYSALQEDDNGLAVEWFSGILQAAKIHTLSRIASGEEPSGYPEPSPSPESHGGGGKTKWPPHLPC